MRTLVIVRALKTGGMERVAINLADAFAEQGHESHLLFYKKRKDALYPEQPGVTLHSFNINQVSLLRPASVVSEVVAKICNVFWRKSYFLIAGWFGGKRLQKKIAELESHYGAFDRIVFRGEGTYEMVWSFQHPKAIYVLENLIKPPKHANPRLTSKRYRALFHNKHLAAVSTGVMEHARQQLAEHQIYPASLAVITNPCPIKQIRAQALADKPEGLPEGPYMVNVARLVPQKGHGLLLQAYAKSAQQLPLVIVGSGKLESALKLQAKALGIEHNVYFAGNQSNPYVWMKHASLFVLSSQFEGLGIVLFEALACGTPIISVACPGGVSDVFKGELEPYLCARTDTALAEKMDQVIDQGGYQIDEKWLDDFRPETIVRAFLTTQ